ncbi:MAG: penicillin binding transpeptidase domain protein [Candidatus Xenolissoclinum pacificiensis L6]|uniref:Penicillin binding transpeptidase domain protein n=1 Tax=Candidatus Xenolissoclinum pacificiensis L6 TaxID=1401685 RepID=W2UYU4_9RICK|nr:MAG: penicillin binding transpeptidase domain protein [Candidatus Xenolissoclinum pacificiensis L6]
MLLASDVKFYSVYANPMKIKDKEKTASLLGSVFPEIEYSTLYDKLHKQSHFVWIKKNITPRKYQELLTLGIPGLYFETTYRRVYPQQNMFAHIIGYVNIDNSGIAGIEYFLNNHFMGEEIFLTLDHRVQYFLRKELKYVMKRYRALGASGIVIDVNNGDIIAMSSIPDFDPNKPYTNVTDAQRFNKTTLGIYEIGSIFKFFTLALALQEKVVDLEESIFIQKPYYVAGFEIKDLFNMDYSTVREIVTKSSNIGIAMIAQRLEIQQHKDFLISLGFADKLSLPMPEVTTPLFPMYWDTSTQITASYGYGLSISLLHTIIAFAALANGGILHQPQIFLSDQPVEGKRVIGRDISEMLRGVMAETVVLGTGKRSKIEGYNIGGKSGSAEKSILGKYRKDQNLASFIAVFPIEDPKYAILIMVDEPKREGFATGGIITAPSVKNVIEDIAVLLDNSILKNL